MARVLITGGAGFIGSHVARVLLEHGFQVRSYDLQPSNVEHVESVQGNILDRNKLDSAVQGCDSIVHLAAQISVPHSIKEPEETMNLNVNGTQHIFDSAKKFGVSRILLASSAAVYGDAAEIPLEEDKIGTFLSPYASSKYENEQQVLEARKSGVEAVALRFFNVYGPNQSIHGPYAAAIPFFIQQIKNGERPSVYGDGQQTRDFVHVQDVALCLLKLLQTNWNKVNSHVYNVATQTQISVLDLIGIMNSVCLELGILQKPVYPLFEKARTGDIQHSVANIDRITREIEWQPTIEIQQGIRELIQLSVI